MYVYLPEIGKVKRISARQVRGKLLGTDFSYEELERIYGQASAVGAVRLPDGEREGRPVYAIEATGPAGSAYAKVVTTRRPRDVRAARGRLLRQAGRAREGAVRRPGAHHARGRTSSCRASCASATSRSRPRAAS